MGQSRFLSKRVYQSLSYLVVGSLSFSASAPALFGLADTARAMSIKLKRQPKGAYTDSPHAAFLGAHPGRTPHSRGGLWSSEALSAHQYDQYLAGIGGGYYLPHASAVADSSGPALPWEGKVPDSSGSVNSGNGDKLTAIELFGWTQRGGMPIEFTLYHNSEGGSAYAAGYGWSNSFNLYINNSSGSPVVHWGDGLSIPYTASSGGGGGGGTGGTGSGSSGPSADEDLTTTYTPPAGIYDALVQNSGGTWTLTKKDGTVYNYNAAGYCTSIVDRNGNTASLTWSGSNLLTSIVDATGRTITIGYTGTAMTSITDPMSHVWTLTQNGSGDLTSIGWPALGGSSYTDGFSYSNHMISSHVDRWGKTWSFTYNSDGSLASESDPLSHSTSYAYTSSSETTTDPLGHTATDNYSSGVVSSHVDESGYTTNYTARDSNYNPTSITDARGNVWVYTYDSLGNTLTVKDPLLHTKTWTYNGFAEILTFSDALSHVTTDTYDTHGNLLTVTDPLSHVNTNAYDGYGELVSSTDALSHTTTFGYDSNGNVSYKHTPLGNATTFGYDAMGHVSSVTDPLSHVESTSYDVWGRKSLETHADSSTIGYSYLPTGEVQTVTDENGHVTSYGYDNAERLTSVTNARGDVESYGYDAADHKTSVTNGRGYTRTYVFSNRGEITKLTMPDGMVEQWAYDGNGNQTAYVDGIGNTITYVFDVANRQTGITYPSGTNTTFSYDNADRKTGMSDATGSTSWTFDNASRVTALSTPEGSVSYGYDNAGRRTSMTENGTLVTSYVYDNDSRRTSLTNSDSETTSWTYDNAARVLTQTVASGEVSTFGYDSRNRETSVSHATSGSTVLESESYVYDYAGNLSSKTVGSTTTSYTYDAADQLLTESNGGSYSASYTYDANGNRTSKTLNGVTDTYTVDSGDKLTSTSAKSYTYDADGRPTAVTTSAGTTTLSYDYESRLTSLTAPSSSAYTYAYNGIDTLVAKNEGTAQSLLRDGADVESPVLSDSIGHFTPDISEHTLATTFNHADHIGSFNVQTNASQTVTAQQSFDAFGLLIASSGTKVGPLGFAGESGYQTDLSGLMLVGHRYYDASTGRFLTRDPVKDGRNWYAYVDSNPTTNVDPDGYQKKKAPKKPHHSYKGPITLPLEPYPGNKMHHRGGFLIHGPHKHDKCDSSEGCIVVPLPVREKIKKLRPKDPRLHVVND